MDVKDAVKAAKDWLVYVMADELPANVGLEEVEFDEPKGIWNITLGFSRPCNSYRNALSFGESIQKRNYRTIKVKDSDGSVQGMVRKLSAED